MTNAEVFEQHNTEKWVIEQTLCSLLQNYWEEHGKKAIEQAKKGYTTSNLPYNSLKFVKEFMKKETLCDVEDAEKSKIASTENNIVKDADFIELT